MARPSDGLGSRSLRQNKKINLEFSLMFPGEM